MSFNLKREIWDWQDVQALFIFFEANAWLSSWVDFTYERHSLSVIYILLLLPLVVIKIIFKRKRVISVVYFLLFNFMPLAVHNFKGIVSIICDILIYILPQQGIKYSMVKYVARPEVVFADWILYAALYEVGYLLYQLLFLWGLCYWNSRVILHDL